VLTTAPKSDPYRAPANFLLGDALSQLGRWKEAEKSYLAYLPLANEIQAMTWQRIGAARKADGNQLGATQAYSSALQSSFDWTNTVAIRRLWLTWRQPRWLSRAAAIRRQQSSQQCVGREMQLPAQR
jgi:tetratricopeptide (TPR) repeat protein